MMVESVMVSVCEGIIVCKGLDRCEQGGCFDGETDSARSTISEKV